MCLPIKMLLNVNPVSFMRINAQIKKVLFQKRHVHLKLEIFQSCNALNCFSNFKNHRQGYNNIYWQTSKSVKLYDIKFLIGKYHSSCQFESVRNCFSSIIQLISVLSPSNLFFPKTYVFQIKGRNTLYF